MRIRCQYARLSELAVDDAQAADRWLSLDERSALDAMRSGERRRTWLGGRMLAKRILLSLLEESGQGEVTPVQIHIETRSTNPGHGERPAVSVRGEAFDGALSIAHTSRGVLVAATRNVDLNLGVDLVERAEANAVGGLGWTFSENEQHWLSAGKARDGRQVWALKEALYKAAQRGEGFTPAQIETVPGGVPRYPGLDAAAVRSLESWRVDGQFAALAVVGRSASVAPNAPLNRAPQPASLAAAGA